MVMVVKGDLLVLVEVQDGEVMVPASGGKRYFGRMQEVVLVETEATEDLAVAVVVILIVRVAEVAILADLEDTMVPAVVDVMAVIWKD